MKLMTSKKITGSSSQEGSPRGPSLSFSVNINYNFHVSTFMLLINVESEERLYVRVAGCIKL